jgi:hypothetical protein
MNAATPLLLSLAPAPSTLAHHAEVAGDKLETLRVACKGGVWPVGFQAAREDADRALSCLWRALDDSGRSEEAITVAFIAWRVRHGEASDADLARWEAETRALAKAVAS